MIPAQEMADMQAEVAKSLSGTCTIQRNPNRGTPVHGIVADSWSAVYPNIAASYRTPTSSFEQNLASELGLLQAWVVSLPVFDATGAPVVVQVGDRCIIAGMTLVVQAPLNQSIDLSTQFMAGEVRTK